MRYQLTLGLLVAHVLPNSQVAFYEKVLEAAGSLGLERLTSLVEWECRQLVNTTTVSNAIILYRVTSLFGVYFRLELGTIGCRHVALALQLPIFARPLEL